AFGRARPARGFSADLRVLARLGDFAPERKPLVLAPATGDAALWQYVNELRQQGMRVIFCREQDTPQADYSLQIINGQWQLVQVQPA
ncbi:hypothetical protein Q4595_25120, partial [Wenyingzhuangia sp. 1_MG-2023]|nr:hypothetical protein [Wenyingzhuangia sp. 1_MG-2023]